MEQVVITESVYAYLDNLIEILYEDEYKGYRQSAEEYVNVIFDFLFSIPHLKCRQTNNKVYGDFYCYYTHNKKTTWYATFNKEKDAYIIKNVTNNHSAEYPIFIASIK
jgi:hypothetical protein